MEEAVCLTSLMDDPEDGHLVERLYSEPGGEGGEEGREGRRE